MVITEGVISTLSELKTNAPNAPITPKSPKVKRFFQKLGHANENIHLPQIKYMKLNADAALNPYLTDSCQTLSNESNKG